MTVRLVVIIARVLILALLVTLAWAGAAHALGAPGDPGESRSSPSLEDPFQERFSPSPNDPFRERSSPSPEDSYRVRSSPSLDDPDRVRLSPSLDDPDQVRFSRSLEITPTQALQCTRHAACGAGRLCLGDQCRPAESIAAPGGRVYWVDQRDPRARDTNPGTRDLPWATIGRAAGSGVLQPGDAVIVRGGIYRESVRPHEGGRGPDRRIAFVAYPGDDVVVTGADVFDHGWSRQAGLWRLSWTNSLRAYGDREFRRELVAIDGHVLRPVYDMAEVRPGSFFAAGSDRRPEAIFLLPPGSGDLGGRLVEIATRHPLFAPRSTDPNASCGSPGQPGWLHVVGFTFRHAANRAQWGAVCAGSEGSLFEENTIEWTNGLGIDVSGRGHVFRANRTVDNGQMGFGGSCVDCLLSHNESSRNNWKGHSPFWEAGGGKFVRTRNTVIRHHLARDNEGPGIWFDIDNADNVVEHSLVSGNRVAGIMLELATVRTVVRDNLVIGTRWQRWGGTGLLIQASSHNVIVNNTFAHNEGGGLWVRLDPDRRAPDGHNVIYNNLFVANASITDGEAREISVRGSDLSHARTNRLDGNVYWAHPSSSRISTFYFAPDPSRQANFRSDDLFEWRTLTQGDAAAVLLAAHGTESRRLLGLRPTDLPIGSSELGFAVPLPVETAALVSRSTTIRAPR